MNDQKRGLGTFEGVFTPTILTILGVIMYLRLGWVVGNAGLGGAILIIALAKVITITTGFSIASIATNSKVGAGGSYALISRSLGLEVGSAVGIPLYLSQTLGGAMYITGFTEAWIALFPTHPPMVVAFSVLVLTLVISLIGAGFAMRSQFIVMAIIFASLISLALGRQPEQPEIELWGNFPSTGFWAVFAIFFPAVTGIEAGAAMSGDLKDSRKSLPLGILSAIGISMLIYFAVAAWLDHQATREQLLANNTIMFDLSRWRNLLAAGVLGATFSSALGSVVGAPRTLMAMGQDRAIPFHRFLARKTKRNEPIPAILFTSLAILVALVLGDLNTIAPLLTMFFLITYATINAAVAIEKGIGIPSFRPRFSSPIWVPILGSLWALVIMFLINPVFAGVAWLAILAFYVIQVKRGLRTPWGDVRMGFLNAISEWGARKVAQMPHHPKNWKPNLMIPVEDPANWTQLMTFLQDIVFPAGTLRVFSVRIFNEGVQVAIRGLATQLFGKRYKEKEEERAKEAEEQTNQLESQLDDLLDPVRSEGILATSNVIECHNFLEGMSIITQVMHGMHFPPNVIFLTMSADRHKDDRLEELIAIAIREHLGIVVLSLHAKAALGNRKTVNIWLRRASPNKDLAVLMGLQLQRNWEAHLRFISVASDEETRGKSQLVLNRLIDRTRMPSGTEGVAMVGEFKEALENAPMADINIFGLSNELDADQMHELAEDVNTSCLFVKDGGGESMLV